MLTPHLWCQEPRSASKRRILQTQVPQTWEILRDRSATHGFERPPRAYTHTTPPPNKHTHTHSFKRKGNPDTLHWHSRHLLPSLQIQWQLFLSNPSNPLAHLTHTHTLTQYRTHKRMYTEIPETLTPSCGAGGWGIATTHFASMQPPSKLSGHV